MRIRRSWSASSADYSRFNYSTLSGIGFVLFVFTGFTELTSFTNNNEMGITVPEAFYPPFFPLGFCGAT